MDRINIPPRDPTPPGHTAPLPLFTDRLLPPPPQHSTHIVTTWGTDPQFRLCVCVTDRVRYRDRGGERRGGCVHVPWGCMSLESWGNIRKNTDQLRGSAYANFPTWWPHCCTAVAPKDSQWELIMWPGQLQVYRRRVNGRKRRKPSLMSAAPDRGCKFDFLLRRAFLRHVWVEEGPRSMSQKAVNKTAPTKTVTFNLSI